MLLARYTNWNRPCSSLWRRLRLQRVKIKKETVDMAVLINCPAILCAWNEKHWLEPELVEQMDLRQVKLVLHFRSENVVKDVVKDVVKQLTVRQQLLLEMIRQDNTISARAMSESLSGKEKVAERTVQRDLGVLETQTLMGQPMWASWQRIWWWRPV